MCGGAVAGRWLARVIMLCFVGGWLAGARGCLGARLFACGITIIGYRYLVVGGVWLTQMVFGVRWCIVGCLGWHMVVVPGLAAGDCHGCGGCVWCGCVV